MLLYVYCRWGQPNLFEKVSTDNLPPYDSDDRENTGMPVIESLDTLLEWMQEDPVDTWEMSRNDCVQQVQGNRNVFIDYPEFAWLLFGRELPADYDTPSGYAREHGSDGENFTLTAASSDETRGTVTVRSHTVTAFPAEGYCVGGCTLTPADAAVVKQNGNVFTVSRMTKDCTLTVQFDPRTPSTVHFSVPEGVTAPADAAGYTGDTFTFPQPSGTPSDTAHDYTFFGWAAAPQTDTDSRPDFSAAGAEQVFTQAEQTYYALYYYKVDDPDAVGDEYRRVMVAPDDWTGSYCIVSSDKGKIMTNTPGSKPTYLEAADIEIDTGMGRYGFLPGEMDKLLHIYSYMDGLDLCGIYTHFHSAFCNKKATDLQMVCFRSVIRQLQEKGIQEPYADVLRELEQRDYDDTHRAIAPLKAAPDAVHIDTSDLTLEQSIDAVCAAVRTRFGLEADA